MTKKKSNFRLNKRIIFLIIILFLFNSLIVSAQEVNLDNENKGILDKFVDFFKNLLNVETKEKISELKEVKPFDKEAKEKRIKDIRELGKPITKTGILEVLHFDDFDKGISENKYFIRDENNKRFKIYDDPKLIVGTRLTVTGKSLEIQGKVEIVPEETEVVAEARGEPEENPNLGERRTIVVIIDDPNSPPEPPTETEARNLVFNENNNSLNNFIKEVSFGKTWLTGDIFGPYTVDDFENECNFQQVVKIIDPDVNFTSYSELIVSTTGCAFAYIGAIPVITDEGVVNLRVSYTNIRSQYVTNHEFIHTLGVLHANDWECGESIIGDNCISIEYGDTFDIMGSVVGHPNAPHKDQLGWFDPSNIIETNVPGTYFIEPLETPGEGVKALKIPLSNGNYYYVEYRRPIGYDVVNSDIYGPQIYDGAMLHLGKFFQYPGGDTHLLDTSPQISIESSSQGEDSIDVVLREGEMFYDSLNNVAVSTIKVTGEFLEVYLGLPNCGNGIVNFPEECDEQNLNGNTCESIGFRERNLSCTTECRFDTSLCENPICVSGDTYNADGSCTAVFAADPEDAVMFVEDIEDWDKLRNRETGFIIRDQIGVERLMHLFVPRSTDISLIRSRITRISIPFDTSSLPNTAIINSAELALYPWTFRSGGDSNPNLDDFITVVSTNLENLPFLSENDFSQFGSVDNPTELANRIDVSENVEFELVFTLNAEGLANINKEGYSGFGLRGGYDLFTIPPNRVKDTELKIAFSTGNSPFAKPNLIVNYNNQLEDVFLKEEVKCTFSNSSTEQKCSSDDALWICKGITSCVVDVAGKKGDKIEWTSSCGGFTGTVIDGVDETAQFTCGADSNILKETVKCTFLNSNTKQKCSSDNGLWSCQGITSCTAEVAGEKGDRLTWKSTCGGIADTIIDGVTESAIFKCSDDSNILKEKVKCTFANSKTIQKCSSDDSLWICTGITSCTIDVSGKKGDKIEWTSSCGGFTGTVIDGVDETAQFTCGDS